MFDPRTAELLQGAPSVPGLDADDLPKALTRAYAQLVSERLEGGTGEGDADDTAWPIDRIADTYEIIASLEERPALRRSAAFVAGTAQQIISRRVRAANSLVKMPVDRDSVEASLAAALLFLAAEQYADANEAGAAIVIPREGLFESRELGRHVRDLVRGNLGAILQRGAERALPVPAKVDRFERSALRRLLRTLAKGIEHLAAHLLANAGSPLDDLEAAQALFAKVRRISAAQLDPLVPWTAHDDDSGDEDWGALSTSYSGPAHLASLLLTASDGIAKASLTRIPPPDGANAEFWSTWLQFRAETMPFVWRNHREAIEKDFHQPGRSAVLVLPTGAGKTTVSVLKIASTLALGKKVVFLAPTHALVEQLTDDLQALFPKDRFGLNVSSDFDSLLLEDVQLEDIEVMTPERCLAMLSFAPDAFGQVGLLVFDECHLLSPSRNIGRALDSILCMLAFQQAAPNADMLLLSAMLKNGRELAAWVQELTSRPCELIELLWKPSRQARGVVVYHADTIAAIEEAAFGVQCRLNIRANKVVKQVRAGAERELSARPWILWGLQHNWTEVDAGFTHTRITEGKLPLKGGVNRFKIWATPNANQTAAAIAINAVATGLKTIIFVNKKADAVGTAEIISKQLTATELIPEEQLLLDALEIELGDRRHAIFGDNGFSAVPHNGSMLGLERKLSEKLFRRSTGAKVIVATPTLAQGLNLPAELAILAGDKRSGDEGDREELEAHELLNAAGRAGRAGHLANGVVILIPEPIITFRPRRKLPHDVVRKLKSVLPEDDRCIELTDALEVVLDRVMAGDLVDRDVRYTVNRLAALSATDSAITSNNLLVRSFAAYRARQRGEEQAYMTKLEVLWAAARVVIEHDPHPSVILLASQSGMALDLLERLRQRLIDDPELPTTITDWIMWVLDWLSSDEDAQRNVLGDTARAINASIGRKADTALDAVAILALKNPTRAWLEGQPLNAIEGILGGSPDSLKQTQRLLPRAREFVGTVIPRSLSFTVSVVARMAEEIEENGGDSDRDRTILRSLSGALRRGFDTVAKLEYAYANRALVGRVEVHRSYQTAIDEMIGGFDEID